MSADPTELGPYRLVRVAGRGGMGVVYEALHGGLNKRVALKVLPRERAKGRLDRFLREARTAAGLHHTNIVPVFDVGEVGGVPYYAMQFIDGKPLDALLHGTDLTRLPSVDGATRTQGPQASLNLPGPVTQSYAHAGTTASHLPGDGPAADGADHKPHPVHVRPDPYYVSRLCLQAAEGLAYAHARGIVHRDIKPTNLLLDPDSIVWITDFGLAFRPDDPGMTADGAVLGTPRYMSPEQARAEKTDTRTDVYSLGVTLYELLTGHPAFFADSVVGTIQLVLTHTPPPPRSLNRKIPRDLETVVLKAMAKAPADRYASGRELADDLKRFLNGEAVKARRVSVVGKAWRWAKRNPAVATLLAAVLLVFAGGAGLSAYYAGQAAHRERDALANEALANQRADEAKTLNEQLGETLNNLNVEKQKVDAEKRKVDDANRANRRLLYAAHVNLAGVALRENRFERVAELLRETLPQPGQDDLRGWEWYYLYRQVHTVARRVDPASGDDWVALGPTRFATFEEEPMIGTLFGMKISRKQGDLTIYDADTAKPVATRVVSAIGGVARRRVQQSGGDGRWAAYKTLGEQTHWVVVELESGRELGSIPEGFWPRADHIAMAPDTGKVARPVLVGDEPAVGPPAPAFLSGRVAYEIWTLNAKAPPVVTEPVPDLSAEPQVQEAWRECVLSPDGRWLAVLSPERRCVVFDAATGKIVLDRRPPVTRRRVPPELVNLGVAFSPDGKRFAVRSTSDDGFELYDTSGPSPRFVQGVNGLAGPVTSFAFAPDGKRLLVDLANNMFGVFDLAGRQPPHWVRTVGGMPTAMYFRPDGRRVFGYLAGTILEWDLSRPPARAYEGSAEVGHSINAVMLSPNGKQILVGVLENDFTGHVRLDVWDRETGAVRTVASGPALDGASAMSFQWLPDGRVLYIEEHAAHAFGFAPPLTPDLYQVVAAVRLGDEPAERLIVLDAATGRRTNAFWSRTGANIITVSRDGRYVTAESATDDRVFDLHANRAVQDFGIPSYKKEYFWTTLVADPDRFVVVRTEVRGDGKDHGRVEVTDLATGRKSAANDLFVGGLGETRVWVHPRKPVIAFRTADDTERKLVVVEITPDGPRLVKEQVIPADPLAGNLTLAAYSTDGAWLAVPVERRVLLFDTRTWELAHTLTGGVGNVSGLTFDPKGERLFVRYEDADRQEVTVWDTRGGQELLTVACGGPSQQSNNEPIAPHFDGRVYVFARLGEEASLEVETLDGTPVPDAEARKELEEVPVVQRDAVAR
jgi:serine/threonine protein kinase/WD40 repeat protein